MKDKYSLGEIELLSCCLDDELSEVEKEDLQARLKADPGLQNLYTHLQRTRTILRNTPKRTVPRNFFLPADSIKTSFHIPSFTSVLRFSSVMAAIGLVFLLALEYLPVIRSERTTQVPATSDLMAAAPAEKSIEMPMIITWGAPLSAYGIGGGAGSDASPVISYVIPREVPAADVIPLEMQPVEPPPLASEQPLLESEQKPQQASTSVELVGAQPLLGVRPQQERGKIVNITQPGEQPVELKESKPLRIYHVILGAIAIISAIISFLLPRKKKPTKLE